VVTGVQTCALPICLPIHLQWCLMLRLAWSMDSNGSPKLLTLWCCIIRNQSIFNSKCNFTGAAFLLICWKTAVCFKCCGTTGFWVFQNTFELKVLLHYVFQLKHIYLKFKLMQIGDCRSLVWVWLYSDLAMTHPSQRAKSWVKSWVWKKWIVTTRSESVASHESTALVTYFLNWLLYLTCFINSLPHIICFFNLLP